MFGVPAVDLVLDSGFSLVTEQDWSMNLFDFGFSLFDVPARFLQVGSNGLQDLVRSPSSYGLVSRYGPWRVRMLM